MKTPASKSAAPSYVNDFVDVSGLKSESHKKLLDMWLTQHKAMLQLDELIDELGKTKWDDEHEVDSDYIAKLKGSVSPFGGNLEVGQIRLFSHEMVAVDTEISYFSIISKWEGDMWLIVPHSPYSVPATNSEFSTKGSFKFRKTLQCWNARTVQSELVAKSWISGKLSKEEVNAARKLVLHQMTGEPIQQPFGFTRGGPIMLNFDPRIDYMRYWQGMFAPLSAMARNQG